MLINLGNNNVVGGEFHTPAFIIITNIRKGDVK
jgi:hypothetical protein